MSDVCTCMKCGKNLAKVKEIHATEGMLFCSESCTIEYYMDDIIANAKEQAKKMYADYAEVISPKDIGL